MISPHRPGLSSTAAVLVAVLILASCDRHEKGAHGDHAMPKDWKFALAGGDAAAGRELFLELECFKCHEVEGEKFPGIAAEQQGVGPELSQMAGSHTLEFFFESIVNPDAVIDDEAKEKGHVGPDGRSRMPSFAEVLTVKQVSDLASYLDSLAKRRN